MAFDRREIFYIPSEFRHLPEAQRVVEAEAEFWAAHERERKSNTARVRVIGEEVQRAQKNLQEAQDAFDAAAGLPVPAPLTGAVKAEIARLFLRNLEEVASLLEKRCGRTIPFNRDSDSFTLDPYRLCVLRLSKGDLAALKEWVEWANVWGHEFFFQ
jgi:hypothetical protein